MSTLRKKVHTSSGLQNIGAIGNTASLSGSFTSDPQEMHAIKQGQPVDAEQMLRILQDLIYNDLALDAQQNVFFPLISEGVLPIRSTGNFAISTNDIVTTALREVTIANPTSSVKIKAEDCRIKVKDTIIPMIADQDFVTTSPGLGQIQINAISAANSFRTVVLQVKLDGSYDLKYLGTETLLRPDHGSRLDEDNDAYVIYSFILKKIGADTKIVSIKRVFDLAGFNNFFLRDYTPWHQSKEYDNVFRLFLEDSRHLRKENFDLLDQTYATATDNSLAEVELSDAVFYNNDASAAQAKFKFDSLAFPEILPEPDHNIYSYPGDTTTGSGIYHYIVPGDQDSAAIPFPEYPSPASGLRSIGHLYFNKVANAGAFQNTAKLKSLTLALYKSPLAAFDDNIKVAIVNLPRFTQNNISLSQFNAAAVTTPSPGITQIVCDDAGIDFNNVSAWDSDYPAFVNTQLNVGDIVFFINGPCAGYATAITEITNGTTIKINSMANAVTNGNDFIIFKNVPIVAPYVAGEVEFDVTTLNNERTIALGPATNLVSSTAGTDDYFKVTKDNQAITIYKEKYYFVIPKVAVADDDIVSNNPQILINNNATNVAGAVFRNIYFYATYFPSNGEYPSTDFTLYDSYGDLGSSNATRLAAWSNLIGRWDMVAKDLNDTEIDIIANGGWIAIALNQCFVDVTRGIAMFHPDRSPMYIYGTYRIESFVGSETNSTEIKRQGMLSSIEDWMKDKFPDGVDAGLLYTKKKIQSKDSRSVVIPAGYIAYANENVFLTNDLNIEDNAELIFLGNRQPSFLFWVTQGLAIEWEQQTVVGTGSLQYPQFRTFTLASEIVRVTYTYDGNNNPLTQAYEYSKNGGLSWINLGTKNLIYSGLYLTNTYWS